jgi:flavodoxin
MKTCIVFDSQFGNTLSIAQIIGNTLQEFGPVKVVRVDPEHPLDVRAFDLLIVGSPTQGFRATPAMASFVEHISASLLSNLALTSFDTRVHGPWGSAARHLARRLRAKSGALLVSPMSFFVKGTPGPLIEGEEERAAQWALQIRQHYIALQHHLVVH